MIAAVHRHRLTVAGILAALPGVGLAATAPIFDIPAGPLDAALMTYAAQSHRQILYGAEVVRGRQAPAVKGALDPDAVLSRLLAGTDILAQTTPSGAMVLKRPEGTTGGAGFPDEASSAAPAVLDTLVITGSNIRGVGHGASPLQSLDREALDRAGFATLADALSALPQAYGGASTPASLLALSDDLGTNSGAATGVNLRGLGANATLVLVDGKRLAGTGSKGDFADISAIPTAAVARVDVLLDGASALYGADAVGGVVNVILKKDFEGAETRLRIGAAAKGDALETQVGQTFGHVWSGGHLLLSYEGYHRDALPIAARAFTASDDLRPLGGADHRTFYAHPGNVLAFDPVASAYVPAYAIPRTQPGVGLAPGDFQAGAVNLQSAREGMDILPQQDRQSLYLAGELAVSQRVSLAADARFSHRTFSYAGAPAATALQVTRANPYFVSPDGSDSEIIGYSFADELGPSRGSGFSDNLGLSASLTGRWGRSWQATGYVTFAQEIGVSRTTNMVNSAHLDEALGNLPDDPATAYSLARDGAFNPFVGAGANRPAILAFIASGASRLRNVSRTESFNLKGDGELLTLPGGPLKLAIGADIRQERFSQRNANLLFGSTPSLSGGPEFRRTVTAAFAELNLPIVGTENARPGLRRLELSAAGRIESFDDVGESANPKLGLLWEPLEGLRLRSTYGTSFRAPGLPEVNEPPSVSATFLTHGAAQTLTVVQYGGNRALRPERATTWTAGFDATPAPGLSFGATWFDTEFSDRIGQPAAENISTALSDPALAPFAHLVDPANPADVARVAALIADPSFPYAGLFPTSAYGAIVDARFVNTARVRVSGLDANLDYGWSSGVDRFDLSGAASYLIRFERQITPLAPTYDLVNTVGHPAALRARGQASWSRRDWTVSLAGNYVGAYRDTQHRRIAALATLDAQVRWEPSVQGMAHGLVVAVNVQNLLDSDPPFYDSPQGVGFDAANGDPLGRVVSLQVQKRW